MPWLILGIGIGCFALERAVPGWKLPPVRTWPLRVALANLVQLAVVLLAGAPVTRGTRRCLTGATSRPNGRGPPRL